MPDVWTHHPEMLRDFLVEAGLPCGVEPRVLHPRDPYWTCHIDGKGWIGDIYIHNASSPLSGSPFFDCLFALLLVTFASGYLLGRLMQRKMQSGQMCRT